MTSVPARLYDTDSMEQVMRTFDDTKVWNLPVVDTEGKYLGFVSKSKIFNSYRQVLVHFQKINKEMVMRKKICGLYIWVLLSLRWNLCVVS